MTKSEFRLLVLQEADAVGSDRWDADANKEVDIKIAKAIDREWANILNANRTYKFATWTPTSHATTGRYAISDIEDTSTANAHKRFYRILSLIIDKIPYEPVDYDFYPMAEEHGANLYVYWREGSNLMVMPKQLSKLATVVTNYTPTKFTNLTLAVTDIDFPDGHELLPAKEAAALLLDKGGAETQAAAVLRGAALGLRAELLQDISRLSTKPKHLAFPDQASDWGG